MYLGIATPILVLNVCLLHPIYLISEANYRSDKPRKFDIEIDYAFKDIDTIDIKIPDGYIAEALPKNVTIEK